MKYFVQTIRFNGEIPECFNMKQIDEKFYINELDNSKWIYRPLADLGWGKEHGFCRYPILPFDKLFNLTIKQIETNKSGITDDEFNLYGSLAILLEDYPIEFLNHLEKSINQKIITKSKNDKLLSFIELELYYDEKTFNKLANKIQQESILKWKEIKEKYL